jgi:hypothetical protein
MVCRSERVPLSRSASPSAGIQGRVGAPDKTQGCSLVGHQPDTVESLGSRQVDDRLDEGAADATPPPRLCRIPLVEQDLGAAVRTDLPESPRPPSDLITGKGHERQRCRGFRPLACGGSHIYPLTCKNRRRRPWSSVVVRPGCHSAMLVAAAPSTRRAPAADQRNQSEHEDEQRGTHLDRGLHMVQRLGGDNY